MFMLKPYRSTGSKRWMMRSASARSCPIPCLSKLLVAVSRLVLGGLLLLLVACSGGGGGSSSPSGPAPGAYSTADAYLEGENFVGSILVLRDGEDVLRSGYGFADKDHKLSNGEATRYRIGSLTKAFTAFAIVQLREAGLIDSYDDPIGNYLPAYPRGNEITIRHLITHRSGIPDYLSRVKESSSYSPAELVALFAGRSLEFDPGTDFSYSNSNYVLLGHLIETISAMSYTEYLQINVFAPLGLINTAYGVSEIAAVGDAKGYRNLGQSKDARYLDMSIPYAAGALVSNLSDLELWGQSFLDQTLASPEAYDEIFIDNGYGFGWVSDTIGGKRAYWHSGGINGFSSYIALFPDQRGMVIALSNVEEEGVLLHRIMETMAENEL